MMIKINTYKYFYPWPIPKPKLTLNNSNRIYIKNLITENETLF